MTDIFAIIAITFALVIAGFMGAHSNIPVDRIELAFELCEPNGGLEYIDWSNAGCKNGAHFKTIIDKEALTND